MNKNEIKTVADLVKKSAKEFGGKTFLKEVVKGEVSEKTFEEFYTDVKKLSGYINTKYSDAKQTHTAVIGPSSYGWLVSWFGTVCGGNTAVPLDAQLSCEDICELLVRSDTDIFCYE
ncbi:MAG: AMP-binding protein, partial [Oscillospiraceae bacterium]|nr:AMP-binding protein [Oscillospiraceae bacterium]